MSKLTDIQAQVKDQVKTSTDQVVKQLVNSLVEIEVNNRVDLLRKAIEAGDTINKEIQKIKPDQTSYDSAGKVVSETYSKTKVEELKKANAKLEKVNKAIDKYIDTGDISDLKNLASSLAAPAAKEVNE